MNIAIFIDTLSGGGAEKVMLTLAKGWLSLGHNVHFFLLSNRTEYSIPNDIHVHALSNGSHRKLIKWWRVKKTAKKMQLLMQQVENQFGQFELKLANLDPSCKVISLSDISDVYYVLHNAMQQEIERDAQISWLKKWQKIRAKQVYHGKNLIAVSKGVATEALNSQYITPASVTKIYNPVDFDDIEQKSELKTSLPDTPYIVHLGRVVKQKRHDVLFQALSEMPDIKLVLLCKYVDKAKKLALKYGVADRIITPGFQQNPYPWLKNANALLSSSDFEGLGMNLIEALACNTPVVSTDCPYGPNEILTDELAEFLVPVGDAKQLAQKTLLAIQHPPQINIDKLKERFSIETCAKAYLDLAQQSK